MLVDKASIQALTQRLNSGLQNQSNTSLTTTASQIATENQSTVSATTQFQSTVVTDSKGNNALLQRLLTGPMEPGSVTMTTTASSVPVAMESNMAATVATTLPQLIDLPLSDGKGDSFIY